MGIEPTTERITKPLSTFIGCYHKFLVGWQVLAHTPTLLVRNEVLPLRYFAISNVQNFISVKISHSSKLKVTTNAWRLLALCDVPVVSPSLTTWWLYPSLIIRSNVFTSSSCHINKFILNLNKSTKKFLLKV